MAWRRTLEAWEVEQPWVWPEQPIPEAAAVEASSQYISPPGGSFDGATFFNGVGGLVDDITDLDYWTLRQRSSALFRINMYARGMIRRYVTNIIHTGLRPEWRLNPDILGITKEQANTYSRQYEQLYSLYCNTPEIIDAKGKRSDGELQEQIETEALIEGDCLVINRTDPNTGLPQIQIVNGSRVQTPMDLALDPLVVDGVRVDKRGRHIGFYVYKGTREIFDDSYEYVPAIGKKTGRKIAWLHYGCDKREDGVRGEPLLSIVIQGLNDISGYKGSSLLKAKINAMIVGSVENTQDGKASLPIPGKAAVKDVMNGTTPVKVAEVVPGFWAQQLAHGEKLSAYAVSGSDVNFGPFETAIVAGMSWALQIPPEILTLSFNSNYSASQAANNEWKMFLDMERFKFSVKHCQNLIQDWFIASTLMNKIEAPGFLNSRVEKKLYDIKRAWLSVEWIGSMKPTTDPVKQANGFLIQKDNGWNTNSRIAREINGTKFEDNVRILKEENEMIADAMRPMLELQKEFGSESVNDARAMTLAAISSWKPTDEEESAA